MSVSNLGATDVLHADTDLKAQVPHRSSAVTSAFQTHYKELCRLASPASPSPAPKPAPRTRPKEQIGSFSQNIDIFQTRTPKVSICWAYGLIHATCRPEKGAQITPWWVPNEQIGSFSQNIGIFQNRTPKVSIIRNSASRQATQAHLLQQSLRLEHALKAFDMFSRSSLIDVLHADTDLSSLMT